MVTGNRGTLLAAKVFPSVRLELGRDTGRAQQENLSLARDLPDLRKRDSGNASRNPFAAGRGKQQFVVFAAVEGELEINLPRWPAYTGPWDGFLLHLRTDAAFFADVGQDGRQPVAGVDHGGSQTLLAQNAAQLDSRLGKEMPRVFPGIQLPFGPFPHLSSHGLDRSGRAAEFSTHIDAVAGSRLRAQYGLALGHSPHNDNVGQNSIGRLRRVAACEGHTVSLSQAEK